MIFKGVREGKPYPDHGLSTRLWAKIPPRQLRLDQLTTVTTVLALDKLLSEDSTFYGDLFAHVVRWRGELYLEDGLHRAVRSALRNRHIIHARTLDLDSIDLSPGAPALEIQLTQGTDTPRPPHLGGARHDAQPNAGRSTGWTLPTRDSRSW
ncbi:type II toxin-antitoxin system VapB family antitoxin [Gordonia sp. ABSL1-1]|uniref:type II toxin-antitoxin system VapB family antitoxin n=1 Tax=Gordonia sp. ABSL1-1 TaxID=3053923 RepID=UPI00257294A0|nr:type II toxin-antitoxin system VapB family antitoxin [Gordonia sp. ABSL1-1]MDL9935513.1 type II toxin-antitoxin system VapB family antitoxin [Gordonia sp. ABSL1-1]